MLPHLTLPNPNRTLLKRLTSPTSPRQIPQSICTKYSSITRQNRSLRSITDIVPNSTGNWQSNIQGTTLNRPRSTSLQRIHLLRPATNWLSSSSPQPWFIHPRSRTSCFRIIASISHGHFPGRGRGGDRGRGRGGPPKNQLPPAYPGRMVGPDDRGVWETLLTAALRELSQIRCERGPSDTQPQQHPHKGRVGQVDWVPAPGALDPRPLGLVVERVCQQKELFQGVTETRSKLLDSYFVLVSIIALLHFLTYIQFLCSL